MKSLKDELRQIEMPNQLHERAVTGIQRAAKEQHRKKWLPSFLAIPLTAAIAYFIWLVSTGPITEQNKQAAGVAKELYNVYWIAGICTALLLVITALLSTRYKKWRKQLALFFVIALSWIWNSAYYEAQQLPQPYVYPISVSLRSEYDFKTIYIHAIINKKDFEKTIQNIVINDVNLPITEVNSVSLESTAHHISTDATLNLKPADIIEAMNRRTPIEAYAFFSDGQKIPFDAEFIEIKGGEDLQGDGIGISTKYRIETINTDITTIKAFTPPSAASSYELWNEGKLIQRVGVNGEEDIDLLPYKMESRHLKLVYTLNDKRELYSYQSQYYKMETADGTMLHSQGVIFFPPLSRDIVKQVRQEMMEHD
ncbi:hypothetical protein [Bacillus ndiopicus]|uniref:hypothetical protein n=1 Tax=Bacillus ndiopicus TaxID=1347368 RepID=UPI0005AA8DD7|nr:hypothetical protein [Bacillus ndiopicus]